MIQTNLTTNIYNKHLPDFYRNYGLKFKGNYYLFMKNRRIIPFFFILLIFSLAVISIIPNPATAVIQNVWTGWEDLSVL